MQNLCVFAAGLLFALGLGVSGMTDANKVIGFLNVAGKWDPSLAFVMVGGIGVHLATYRLIVKRKAPVFGEISGIHGKGHFLFEPLFAGNKIKQIRKIGFLWLVACVLP